MKSVMQKEFQRIDENYRWARVYWWKLHCIKRLGVQTNGVKEDFLDVTECLLWTQASRRMLQKINQS